MIFFHSIYINHYSSAHHDLEIQLEQQLHRFIVGSLAVHVYIFLETNDSDFPPSNETTMELDVEIIPVPNEDDLVAFVKNFDNFFQQEQPDYEDVQHIMTDFSSETKCQGDNYQWTDWKSATNPVKSDGNDYETLHLHRSIDKRLFDIL